MANEPMQNTVTIELAPETKASAMFDSVCDPNYVPVKRGAVNGGFPSSDWALMHEACGLDY